MQRWTDDRLIADKHRVVFRPNSSNEPKNFYHDPIVCPKRQSFAFFARTDKSTIIKSFERDPKYDPIGTEEFTKRLVRAIYKD